MILRQQNWLGQQRVDIPHLRALEASAAADFDLLAGQILGGQQALVVSGFSMLPSSPGAAASSLQVSVANGVLLHTQASEAGSIFKVAVGRVSETLNAANTRVSGGFSANTTNYVGVDLRRTADDTTVDLVQFLGADTLKEKPKETPLARTLDYIIIVSTQAFESQPGVAPLAKVVTDASNNVVSVTDARNMAFRLGTGGTTPNAAAKFAWSGGRTEVGDNTDFSVGDKIIGSLRDWTTAVMTRSWELGGGEHWYSPTADRNVIMARTGTSLGSGDWFAWDGVDLTWQGIRLLFDNSTGYYNDIVDHLAHVGGLTDLADGECIYVDVDRTTNRTGGTALVPHKTTLLALGTPTVPGSRWVMAWRSGTQVFTRDTPFPVGTNAGVVVATTTILGIVKLHQASLTPLAPVVITDGDLDTATGVPKLDANKQCVLTASGGNLPAFNGTGNGSGAGVQGNANASTGPGVKGIASATGTGAGGDFTSNTAGAALSTHASAHDIAISRVYDESANVRAVVDRNGFRLGRIVEYNENWLFGYGSGTSPTVLTSVTGTPLYWITGSNTAFNIIDVDQTSAPVGFELSLMIPNTADFVQVQTNSGFTGSQGFVRGKADTNGSIYVLEFETRMTDAGANGNRYFMGFLDQGGNNFAGIAKRSADNTWQVSTRNAGGTHTYTNTTVATNANQTYKVKIEYHTTNSPLGACVRVWVDGTLTTVTGATVPSGNMEIMFANDQEAANVGSLYISPFRFAYNRFATVGDN